LPRHILSLAGRFASALLFGSAIAACSTSSLVAQSGDVRLGSDPVAGLRRSELLSEGFGKTPSRHEWSSGWMAPDAKRRRALIYWGNYTNNTITVYLAKGSNPPERGQITTGLSGPERLFVDNDRAVYATNLGNSTVTAYRRGATSPYLTISDGVNTPTGLTVDSAGTVYCANLGTDSVTVYPRGQTTPSLTIPIVGAPEYLAIDRTGNLYVSYLGGSRGTGVFEFAPGSTAGTDLGLDVSGAGALAVDRSGNIIIIDDYGLAIDIFPPGQTEPTRKLSLGGGTAFGLSLNKKERKLYATVIVGGAFIVQQLDYPSGTTITTKLETNAGSWPIAVSPDAVF
jgi:hypothetical protein